MTVRDFALSCLGLQLVCLVAGFGLQWVLQLQPENPGYFWLLIGATAPSLVVIGLFGAALFLASVRLLVGVLFAFLTPSPPRR
jgi:hypothetical protein